MFSYHNLGLTISLSIPFAYLSRYRCVGQGPVRNTHGTPAANLTNTMGEFNVESWLKNCLTKDHKGKRGHRSHR